MIFKIYYSQFQVENIFSVDFKNLLEYFYYNWKKQLFKIDLKKIETLSLITFIKLIQ